MRTAGLGPRIAGHSGMWRISMLVVLLFAPSIGLAEGDHGHGRVRASFGLTPELIGLSIAVRARSPLEIEGGIGVGGWFARTGYALRVGHASGTRWEIVPTLGYAKFWNVDAEPFLASVPRDVPHAQVGLGMVAWSTRNLGFEARLNIGAAYAMDYRYPDGTVDKGGVFPIASVSAGIAF